MIKERPSPLRLTSKKVKYKGWQLSYHVLPYFLWLRFISCIIMSADLSDEVSLDKSGGVQGIASETIEDLLQLPLQTLSKKRESRYLEFKSSLRWDYNKLTISKNVELAAVKELPAFMNSAGGLLVIGIDDNGNILGLQKDFDTFNDRKNWDGWLQHLTNLIHYRHKMDIKFSDYMNFEEVSSNGVSIAKIKVQRSPEPVWIKVDNQDTFYVRMPDRTISLIGQEAYGYIRSHWNLESVDF